LAGVDGAVTYTRAVSVTLSSALVDVTSTVTKQAGTIVMAGVAAALTAYSFVVGKIVTPLCDGSVSIPRHVSATRTANVDVSAPLTKAVSVTLVSAFVDVAATVTKQAGKIIVAGVDLSVAAYSFVVGKLIIPVCDITISIPRDIFFTRRVDVDVSASFTKHVTATPIYMYCLAAATVVKQALKIIVAGVDATVNAFSFAVGKIVTPGVDVAASFIKLVSKTLTSMGVRISSAYTTAKGYFRRVLSVLYY
jgi:hypothetical protein